MKAVTFPFKKIIINGNFWDVYLYKNLLFLFLYDEKKVKILDWEKLINSINKKESTKIAFKCSFLNSDFLYTEVRNHIFDDKDFKKLLLKKFEMMPNATEIHMEDNCFLSSLYGNDNTSYPFYFSGLVIYNKIMYIAGEDGIYRSPLPQNPHKRRSQLAFSQIEQTANINVCSLKMMGNHLVFSAQDEGLFEYDNFIEEHYDPRSPLSRISTKHSSYVGINYSSILSSSYIGNDIFFQRYYKIEPDDSKSRIEKPPILISDVFKDDKNEGFYFSLNERIYQIKDGKISYCLFKQNSNVQTEIFSHFTEVWKGDLKKDDIVTASSEEFGVVIQFKDRILVFLSDDTIEEFFGDDNNSIVSYVTYPKSNCYTNQLHIIYDNKIEIISFNQDYFVDQNNKKFGVKHDYYSAENNKRKR